MRLSRGEVAMGRRFGASPPARERAAQENAKLEWAGTCRHCKAALKGTPLTLKEHVCDRKDRPPE